MTFSARSWLFAPGDSEKKMGKAAAGPGVGSIGYKGAMLDRPHLARARALLISGGRG